MDYIKNGTAMFLMQRENHFRGEGDVTARLMQWWRNKVRSGTLRYWNCCFVESGTAYIEHGGRKRLTYALLHKLCIDLAQTYFNHVDPLMTKLTPLFIGGKG